MAKIKVKANQLGFYGNELRKPGQEFFIDSKKELGTWMEEVKPKKSTKVAEPTGDETKDA